MAFQLDYQSWRWASGAFSGKPFTSTWWQHHQALHTGAWEFPASPCRGGATRWKDLPSARALSLFSPPPPPQQLHPPPHDSLSLSSSSSSSIVLIHPQQQHPAVRHGGDASEWCHCTNRISPPRKHAENKALLLRGGRKTFAWRDPLPMKMSNTDMVLNSTDRIVKCKSTFPPSLLPASLFCAVTYALIVKILPQLITTYRPHLLMWSVHL